MKQIYVNTTEKIYLKLYRDGLPVASDSDPEYNLSIVGSSVAPRTGTAQTEGLGVYYITTDLSETEMEGVIKVDWSFAVGGDAGARTDYISVVTPYTPFLDIKDLAPSGTSDKEIENAEVFGRFMINAYTGQTFGKRLDVISMHGNNKSNLVLPHRILRVDSIADGETVLYTRVPEVNNFGRTITITDTHYGLRATAYDGVPRIDEAPRSPAWKYYKWYTIGGVFGWDQVPDEVEYCARVLADDYFCKEIAWKKQFVQQINASDWRIVYDKRQFNGTGNFFVDQILDKYRSIGMVLI